MAYQQLSDGTIASMLSDLNMEIGLRSIVGNVSATSDTLRIIAPGGQTP